MSLNDLIADEPFSYHPTKSGSVQISYKGRTITTLGGREAARFLTKIESESRDNAQLLMAKATGHFKHGNERVSKNAKY